MQKLVLYIVYMQHIISDSIVCITHNQLCIVRNLLVWYCVFWELHRMWNAFKIQKQMATFEYSKSKINVAPYHKLFDTGQSIEFCSQEPIHVVTARKLPYYPMIDEIASIFHRKENDCWYGIKWQLALMRFIGYVFVRKRYWSDWKIKSNEYDEIVSALCSFSLSVWCNKRGNCFILNACVLGPLMSRNEINVKGEWLRSDHWTKNYNNKKLSKYDRMCDKDEFTSTNTICEHFVTE